MKSSATKRTPLASLRPHHVALSVPDLGAASRWYQEKLGFRVVVERDFPQLSLRAANLELNNFQIELFERRGSKRSVAPSDNVPDDLLIQGVKHIALLVDDVDAAIAELRDRGVQVASEPETVGALGLRLAFIRDNNGNLIELGQTVPSQLARTLAPTNVALTNNAGSTTFESYRNRYPNFRLTRTSSGILTIQMHTNNGPLVLSYRARRFSTRLP